MTIPEGLRPGPAIIDRRADGTVVGTLGDELYIGTPRAITLDELDTTVVEGDGFLEVWHSYGGWVQGVARLAGGLDDHAGPERATPVGLTRGGRVSIVDGAGNTRTEPQRRQVVDWEKL